jgi:TRAP-type uncharacterized transport system fused permease subunit
VNNEKNITDQAKEVLEKYDREARYRSFRGFIAKVVAAIAITFSVFQIYTAAFGVLDAMIQRSIHLAFGSCLIFLLYPASKKWPRDRLHWFDLLLAIGAPLTTMYIVANYKALVMRAGTVTRVDFIVGILGIVLVLEATRRIVGLPIVIVALTFILYALYGRYIPGIMAHRGISLQRLVGHLFYTTEGIFGIPLGVSSTFVFLFILLGAFLERTGLGQLFIDIANALAGWATGGPAKVAVFSSGMMGMISGSSVANVVGTGTFTIPMMKKLGYKPEFSGAVEATASTGGQLMPPIMGAAAFLMAEFTGIAYSKIIISAAIPAALYYFGVWMGVHWEAKKLGLRGLSKEELPKMRKVLLERGHLLFPLVAIIYLLVTGFTPMKAALYAIVFSVASSLIRKSTRIKLSDIPAALEACKRSAERRRSNRLRWNNHRCGDADRHRFETGDRVGRSGARKSPGDTLLHHANITRAWHGSAHDGELRHHFNDRRTRVAQARGASSCSTHVRLLLRYHCGRHTTGCTRCDGGRRHSEGESHENRLDSFEACDRGVPRPLCIRSLTSTAPCERF